MGLDEKCEYKPSLSAFCPCDFSSWAGSMSISFLFVLLFSSSITFLRIILAQTVGQGGLLSDLAAPIFDYRGDDPIKTYRITRHDDFSEELHYGRSHQYQILQKRGQSQSRSRKEPKQPPPPSQPRVISVANLGAPALRRTPSIPIPGSTPRSTRSGRSLPPSSGDTSRTGSVSHSPTTPQLRPPSSPSSAPSERQSLAGGRSSARASSATNVGLLRTTSGTSLASDESRVFRRPERGTVPLWATSSSEDIVFTPSRKSRSSSRSKPSLSRPSTDRPQISRASASRSEAQKLLIPGRLRPESASSSGASTSRRPSILGDPSRAFTGSETTASTSKSPGTPEQVSERRPSGSFRDFVENKPQNITPNRQSTTRPQDKVKLERQPSASTEVSTPRFRPEIKMPNTQTSRPPIPPEIPIPRRSAIQASTTPPSSSTLAKAHRTTSNFYNNLGNLPPTSDVEQNIQNARWGQLGKVHDYAAKYHTHYMTAMETPTSKPAPSLPQLLESEPDASRQSTHQAMANFYNGLRKTQPGDTAESRAKQQQYRILSNYHGAASEYFAPPPSTVPPAVPPSVPGPQPPTGPSALTGTTRPATNPLSTSGSSSTTQSTSRLPTGMLSTGGSLSTARSRGRAATSALSTSDLFTTARSIGGFSFTRQPTRESVNTQSVSGSSVMTHPLDTSSVNTRPVGK